MALICASGLALSALSSAYAASLPPLVEKTVQMHNSKAYALPGEDVQYRLSVKNPNLEDIEGIQLIETLSNNLIFYNDAVNFESSTGALSLPHVRFSDQRQKPRSSAECQYTPKPGYDANVRHICILPVGVLEGHAGGSHNHFAIRYRAQIK